MKTNDNEKFVRPDALNEEFKKEVKKPVKSLAVKVDELENNQQAKHWF